MFLRSATASDGNIFPRLPTRVFIRSPQPPRHPLSLWIHHTSRYLNPSITHNDIPVECPGFTQSGTVIGGHLLAYRSRMGPPSARGVFHLPVRHQGLQLSGVVCTVAVHPRPSFPNSDPLARYDAILGARRSQNPQRDGVQGEGSEDSGI